MGARRAFHCLSLLLLPALVPSGMAEGSRPRPSEDLAANFQEVEQSPYLPFLGPPPLRFHDPAPPPDVSARPAAAAPPLPHLTQAESSVVMANSAAANSVSGHRTTESRPEEPIAAPADPDRTAPVPILKDTVRPQVSAEDFLPYFLIPGTQRTVGTVPSAPEPGKLPPSSSTYTQIPK
jgi:hypothetical protein